MSYERVITSSEVFDVMDDLMRDKPEGFGYKDVYRAVKGVEWYEGRACQNWTADEVDYVAQGRPADINYTGKRIPMCIVGQWLDMSGLLDRITRYDSWSNVVASLSESNIALTDEAMRALHMMQNMQDRGETWATAIKAARFAVRADLGLRHAKRDAAYSESYSDIDHDPNLVDVEDEM